MWKIQAQANKLHPSFQASCGQGAFFPLKIQEGFNIRVVPVAGSPGIRWHSELGEPSARTQTQFATPYLS